MPLVLIAIFTSVGFGLYNFFLKVSADKLSPLLATFYLTLTATIVSGIVLLIFRALNLLPETHTTPAGLKFIILAGISTGVADLLYFILFSKGFSLTIGLPLIFASAIVIAIVLSIIFLHEPITPMKAVGILFALAGVVILSH